MFTSPSELVLSSNTGSSEIVLSTEVGKSSEVFVQELSGMIYAMAPACKEAYVLTGLNPDPLYMCVLVGVLTGMLSS